MLQVCWNMLQLCYVMLQLCYVMLCYVMLCYVMLYFCYIMLCYVTIDKGRGQVYVVPIQLDREDEHFAFEAPLRAEIAPSAATLSCQRLTVRTTPGCEELKEVKLQVKAASQG